MNDDEKIIKQAIAAHEEGRGHPAHDPQPDCDCHACAIWERNKLREIVGELRYPPHAEHPTQEVENTPKTIIVDGIEYTQANKPTGTHATMTEAKEIVARLRGVERWVCKEAADLIERLVGIKECAEPAKTLRDVVIEECASVCDSRKEKHDEKYGGYICQSSTRAEAVACAAAIRALKGK